MAAPDHLCVLGVDTTGPVESVSWYDIWAAAVALTGMCVRRGKIGKATGLGELRESNGLFNIGINKSLQV